jgi:hypothetical protein
MEGRALFVQTGGSKRAWPKLIVSRVSNLSQPKMGQTACSIAKQSGPNLLDKHWVRPNLLLSKVWLKLLGDAGN